MLCALVMLLAVMDSDPAAVERPADRGMEMMQALPRLAGRWEGSGTIRMGEGEPMPFVGEELVETRLDGRVVLIEGRHFLPDRSQMVHHAFAVITFDERSGGYRFRTQLSNGRGGDYPARMDGDALVWEIELPQGRMEYVITIDGDDWHETGRIERNGKWYDFFEMKLVRVSD
jgi:hypothetical protein